MWNDNETNVDLIDYSYLVDASHSIISDTKLLPCTIGIFGDWGSGKSSLMKMLEQSFSENENTLCIKFNGWLFEGYEDAKSALLSTIVKQTIKKRTIEGKAKVLAKKLLKNIDWLKLAKTATKHGLAFLTTGGIGNIALGINDLAGLNTEQLKGLVDNFSDSKYDEQINSLLEAGKESEKLEIGMKEFHQNFGNLLKETKVEKLIVFIDDLDRCDPNTVIETLEAIKLFLFAPNTAFIIGADERLIQYAVKRRFPEIPGEKEVSRDYLEKLVQIPIRIPPLSEHEVETFINLLFIQSYYSESEFEEIRRKILAAKSDQLFESIINSSNVAEYVPEEIPKELMDDLILSEQITPILSTGLNGNPRQCKRFLNTLVLRMQMANSKKAKIQKRILAKIMLLEYFKPESFRTLFRWQIVQEGTPKELEQLENFILDHSSPSEDIDSVWLEDSWLKVWLNLEPKLKNENLQPYFFFSKESLTNKQSFSSTRMSSKAQEILNKLFSQSDAVFNSQLSTFKDLSLADSTAIYEEFTSKLKQEEKPKERLILLKRLIDLAENKEELKSEVLVFFENFPTKNIGYSIVPKLVAVFNNTGYANKLNKLFEKWRDQTENSHLTKAVEKELKKMNK